MPLALLLLPVAVAFEPLAMLRKPVAVAQLPLALLAPPVAVATSPFAWLKARLSPWRSRRWRKLFWARRRREILPLALLLAPGSRCVRSRWRWS